MASRGVAAKRMAAMEAASGFGRIDLAQGLGALHAAMLPHASPLLGMVPVQWERMTGCGAAPAFLSSMVVAPAVTERACVPTIEQRVACGFSLEAVLAMVRRTADSSIDADAPLMEAGVDSLGAVELRNSLQRAVGDSVTLSSTLMFDHPTARQLVALVAPSAPPSGAACDCSSVASCRAVGWSKINVLGRAGAPSPSACCSWLRSSTAPSESSPASISGASASTAPPAVRATSASTVSSDTAVATVVPRV